MNTVSDKRFGRKTDGFIRRLLTRRISKLLTLAIVNHSPQVSPNVVTLLGFLLGISSALIFLGGKYAWTSGIVLFLSALLDNVDGELARVLDKESKLGNFLDAFSDRCVDGATIICVTLANIGGGTSFGLPSTNLVVLVGLLALAGSFLVSYSAGKAENDLGIVFSRSLEGRDARIFLLSLGELGSAIWPIATFAVLVFISAVTFSAIAFRIQRILLQRQS